MPQPKKNLGTITRLRDSGSISETEVLKREENMIEKPVLMCYEGEFDSMDGPVKVKAEDLKRIERNHNAILDKAAKANGGVIPLKYAPPLQLDHEVTATHTVGRMPHRLETKMVEIEGKQVLGLFSTMRVLGKENVEKAEDGRWIHVSIGADFKRGVFSELTVTPFPAAPNASMLSRGEGQLVGSGNYRGCQFEVYKHAGGYRLEVDGNLVAEKLPSYSEAKSKLQQHVGNEAHLAEGEVEHEVVPLDDGTFEIYIDGEKETAHAGPYENAEAEAQAIIEEKANAMSRLSSGDNVSYRDRGHKVEIKRVGSKVVILIDGKECGDCVETEEAKGLAKDLVTQAIAGKIKLSKGESDMDKEKLKKRLMQQTGCTADEAEAKLAAMPEEEMKKMSADIDKEEQDKLAAEEAEKAKLAAEEANKSEDQKKLSRFSKRNDEVKRLATDMRSKIDQVKLAARKSHINVRLSRLKSGAKITPAEIKKIDISKLAAENDATVDAVLKSYEDREPVILTGQMGTIKALSASQIAKQVRLTNDKREELLSRYNMPSKRKEMSEEEIETAKRLSMGESETEQPVEPVQMTEDEQKAHKEVLAAYDTEHGEMLKKLEAGDKEGLTSHLAEFFGRLKKLGMPLHETEMSKDAENEVTGLAQEVEHLHTSLEELTKLVSAE